MKEIRRFLKDYKLPIQVYQEPYFSYYIKLLDPYYGSVEKYELFKKTYKQFKDAEEFIVFGSSLVNKVVDHVKSKEEFQKFNTDNDYLNSLTFANFKGSNLYVRPNEGKRFFSVDLKKANFRSLYFYNPKILDNKDFYEDFLLQFIDQEYFLQSKQIRQAIFGNLNPKRQQTIQRHIISTLVPLIEKVSSKDNLRSLSSDEIIIEVSHEKLSDLQEVFNEEFSKPNSALPLDGLHLEEFHLRRFEGCDFYWKEFSNGKVQLRQIPGHNICEAIKKFEGREVHPYDLLFVQDKRLASFKEPLFGDKNEQNNS